MSALEELAQRVERIEQRTSAAPRAQPAPPPPQEAVSAQPIVPPPPIVPPLSEEAAEPETPPAPAPPVTPLTAALLEGSFRVDAVGEPHYQDALEAIAGGRTEEGADLETVALLVPEPSNRYDPNAVQVMIEGKVVGYLSRRNAAILQGPILAKMRREQRAVACRARIVGGWDRGRGDRGHFGVRLYLDPADFGVAPDDLDGGWEEP